MTAINKSNGHSSRMETSDESDGFISLLSKLQMTFLCPDFYEITNSELKAD